MAFGWYRKLTVNTKLAAVIVLFVFIPFIVAGIYWYEASTRTIEDNVIQYNEQMLVQINGRIDAYFAELDKATTPIVAYPLMQEFINKPFGEDEYERHVANQRIQTEIYPGILYGRKDIVGLSIVRNDEEVVTSFQKAFALEGYNAYKDDADDSYFSVKGVRWNDHYPILTASRNIKDLRTNDNKAMLLIDLNFDSIATIVEHVAIGRNALFAIVSDKGRFIYHSDSGKWGEPAEPRIAKLLTGSSGHLVDRTGGAKTVIAYRYSPQTRLTLVSEVPLKEMIGGLDRLRSGTLLLASAVLVLTLAVVTGFTLTVTRSFRNLIRLMRKVENGDLTTQAPPHPNVEIQALHASFNNMVAEIRRLIHIVHTSELKHKELEIKEMEATLKAMQSQINPHFLYNTLEVVNSYAIDAGNMQISEMLHHIAAMFRYSVSDPQQIVPLAEEIRHVETYLNIQRERYDGLVVRMELEETNVRDVNALRLVLQPLVENAFIHGYEKRGRRPEYVGITGEAHEEYFTLIVADRGEGMVPELLDRYNKSFGDGSVPADRESGTGGSSIGLRNVHSRLRMTFGPPYGLFIRKSGPDGTTIEIRLPWRNARV